MSGKQVIKLFLLIFASSLVLYGFWFYKKSYLVANLEEKIKMGKYQDAQAILQDLQNSTISHILEKFGKGDHVIAYNRGVLYTLMEEKKKARIEYRKAMETNDPALKARAIYNNANLMAADMDFSAAASQYAEVLKIDPEDFQAKKNLERMRLAEQQFNTMFSPEKKEREDRIESLKLLPWGTKYRFSGEQKLRW